MRFSTWILGTASLTLLFLAGCVKFETPCTMPDGTQAQVNSQTCPEPSTFSGTGTGVDTATLERPLALATSFGANGRLTIDVSGKEDVPKGILKQSSGKIVVVGQSNYLGGAGTTNSVSMMRLDPSTGATDLTFAVPPGGSPSDGKLIIQDPQGPSTVAGAVAHPNGVLVAGYTLNKTSGDKDFSLLPISADGQPQPNGSGGVMKYSYNYPANFPTPPTLSVDHLRAIGIDSQSRIIMAGSTNASGSETRIAVLRLQPNSLTPDYYQSPSLPGFALDTIDGDAQESRSGSIFPGSTTEYRSGFTIVKVLSNSGTQEANAMAIDSSNRIVLVGKAKLNTQSFSDMFIVRLDASGLIDMAFTRGTYDFGLGKEDVANAVVQQSDGSIVVGGYATGATMKEFALFRVTGSGVIDTSFGTNGYVRLNLGANAEIKTLTLQGSKILALGVYERTVSGVTAQQMAVARFNSDGTVDTTYGTSGVMKFEHSLSGSPAALIGTASLWDGSSLFLGGSGFMGATAGKDDMMIWKLQ